MEHPIDDYIIHFIMRKESPEDVQKLKEWLSVDSAHRDELKQILTTWDILGMMHASDKLNPDVAFRRFMFRLNNEVLP